MSSSDAEEQEQIPSVAARSKPYRIRLPGFTADTDVGLGDVVKRGTSVLGIKPCSGCAQRAAAMNRRFVFSGRRSTR